MSQQPQDLFDRVAELTELYLLDEIVDDQLAELEALVRENHDAADAMRTVLKQAGMMRVVFAEQQQFANRVGEVDRSEYLALLQTLGPTEEPEPVRITDDKPSLSAMGESSGAIQLEHEDKRPTTWVIVIPRMVVWAGLAAAVLAIAFTLSMVLPGSEPTINTPDVAQLSDEPDTPDTPDEPDTLTSPVATLTAAHAATWAEGALAPGSVLRAGQRLTLTAGVAEITTNRGAVAILEAPATIELTDNNNALRLHAGKLVGICETASSKGFLVRTPHMDITDLGTRFGVDADASTAVVHVFEGEVEAIRPDAPTDTEPSLLGAGVSAQTSADTNMIATIEPATQRFAAIQPAPIQLPGTGQGLSAQQSDPNWRVMTTDGSPLDQPAAMLVATQKAYRKVYGQSTDLDGPQWLQFAPAHRPTAQQTEVRHLIQTELELDLTLNPKTARLVIACAADDAVKAIHVNGHRTAVQDVPRRKLHQITIDQHLKTGPNTIAFEVENAWHNDPDDNAIGLYVRWQLLPGSVVRMNRN